MDAPRPNPIGNVESTPEAGPISPPSMRENYAGALPNQPGQPGTGAGTPPPAGETTAHAQSGDKPASGGDERRPEEMARELGDRLKPVMEAAEDVAVKVLDLSAKGLTKLVDSLEERRRPKDDPSRD